MSYFSSSVSHK